MCISLLVFIVDVIKNMYIVYRNKYCLNQIVFDPCRYLGVLCLVIHCILLSISGKEMYIVNHGKVEVCHFS